MLKRSASCFVLLLALGVAANASTRPATSADRVKPARAVAKKYVQQALPVAAPEMVALSATQLAIADKVFTGKIPCELGASVTLAPDIRSAGRFVLALGREQYLMEPVVTSTGAVRLEDSVSGSVWIQVPNKSMLMNQKMGKRLAGECMHPEQLLVAKAMALSPALDLLDGPTASASK